MAEMLATISNIRLNDMLRVDTAAATNSVLVFSLITAITYFTSHYSPILLSYGKSLRNIPWKGGIPILSYKEFHDNPEAFVVDGFKKIGKIFAFRFMTYNVVAVNTKAAQRTFYQHKDLSFLGGWNAIRGVGLNEDGKALGKEWAVKADTMPFVKRAAALFSTERLSVCLPMMCEDLSYYINKWGEKSRFNPWDEYYSAIVHLLLHVSSFRELTLSVEKVHRIGQLLKEGEHAQGFGMIFFPRLTYLSSYLPWSKYLTGGVLGDGDKLKKKMAIVKELMDHFNPILAERFAEKTNENAGKQPVDDQMQVLINQGDDATSVMSFVMLSLFAGTINTYKTACWLTAHVISNSQIKRQVQEELQNVIECSSAPSTEPLSTRIAQVPLSVWETQLPVLDSCIRETIRLCLAGVSSRLNIGDEDIVIETTEDGEQVLLKPGECIIAPPPRFIHLDENLYPNPSVFDPTRYGAEDSKESYLYLGWGNGRHVCPGKRAAELEMKLLVAFFFLQYPNCSLELEDGTPIDTPDKVPEPDDSSLVTLIPQQTIYVRCS